MKKIIVNATALDKGGALSILCQFIENIPDDERQWLIFISGSVSLSSKSNVQIVPVDNVKALHRRLWWDTWGLKRWLNKHDIESEAAISLQNTGFNVGKRVPTFLYYHQSIPFSQYSWDPFKKQERTFWFYKHIYPFFVKLFLKKDTRVFVQLDFIKEGFASFFQHPKELIYVYSPSVLIPKIDPYNASKKDNSDTGDIRLFYPAMDHFYKNHRVIINSLREFNRKVKIYFTVDKIQDFPDDDRIQYVGALPYTKVCEMYNTCDALLFPSYIETFGLPLIEAALTGLPIIAADLPYSREVLKGYDGVTFLQHDKPELWAEAIMQLEKGKRFRPLDISNRPGWPDLFDNIIKKI